MRKRIFLLLAGICLLLWPTLALAAPGDNNYDPSLAYDPQNNRYLLVFQKYNASGDSYIYGKLLNPDGTVLGGEFTVSNNACGHAYYPVVAYDSINQHYLVAWEEDCGWHIYGQLVNADGTLYNTVSNVNFVISNAVGTQRYPSVAYDSANQRYLVVWEDSRGGAGAGIYGQLVNADGTLYNTASDVNFVISNAADGQYKPSVAYDSANQRFLVAWYERVWLSSSSWWDIYGQLVNADGTLYNTISNEKFVISNASDNQIRPSVAYDSANQRYLVVWYDNRSAPYGDIYGQLVNADGTLFGSASDVNFVISNASSDYPSGGPSIGYDSVNQRYLVAWHNNCYRRGGVGIYGQLVNADGTLYNTASDVNFVIYNAVYDQLNPSVAYNSQCANFLVAYETNETCWMWDIGAALVGPNINNMHINPQGDTITKNYTANLTYEATGCPTKIRTSTGTSWSAWTTIPTGLTTKTINLGSTNGIVNVYAQVKDAVGNVSPVARTSIILDTIAPKGVVKINGGNTSVNQGQAVRLHLAMLDANMAGAKMRFKNDSAFASPADDGIAWEDYATAKGWNLSAGTGTKKVYAQFKDGAGKIYSASDSISLVATGGAAFGTLGNVVNNPKLNNDDTYTQTTAVTLTYDVTNPANYEARYLYATYWMAWEALTTSPVNKAITLSTTNGPRQVYVQLREKGTNNMTDPLWDEIILDNKVPTGAIQINNGAFFVVKTGDFSTVILTIIAADSASGIDKMLILQTGDTIPTTINPNDSRFIDFASTVQYTLNTPTTGTKTVYVWFKDKAGNVSAAKKNTISVTP